MSAQSSVMPAPSVEIARCRFVLAIERHHITVACRVPSARSCASAIVGTRVMGGLDQLILYAVSLVAKLFSAFAGGGAGLIQLPALIFLGLPFAVALATHKVASVALGIGATIRHINERHHEKPNAQNNQTTKKPNKKQNTKHKLEVPERVARIGLGVLTIALGVYSRLRPELGLTEAPRHRDRAGYVWGGTGLFVIGVLNGSLTSGTGLFVTLWLVGWFGLDYKRAVAYTLILVGLFWNGSGAVPLAMLSEVRWSWLPALLVGSFVGGYLGAHLAIVKGIRWIKSAYEVITVLKKLSLILLEPR